MKKTFKFAFVALAFAAFTTSCDNAANKTENAVESTKATIDEATSPEAGDTATVIEHETEGLVDSTATAPAH